MNGLILTLIMHRRTFSDEELHNSDQNKKWPYWAPINRLDDMTVFIKKHCREPGHETYVIDMAIFRAGMGIEAVRNQASYLFHTDLDLGMDGAACWVGNGKAYTSR